MKKQMNVKNGILLLFMAGSMFVSMLGCDDSKRNGNCDENNNSTANEDESHKNGENCISCHISGGEGEGCFIAAGSVYDSLQATPQVGGTVRLYTGPNGTGTMVASIPVDKLGNFYTTQQINFGSGVYPSVTSATGKTKYMGSGISNGQCNSCHGVSTDKIWIPN